jgi:hypothetical protein
MRAVVMHPGSPAIRLLLAGALCAALAVRAHRADAQQRGVPEPGACVRAVGPDSGAAPAAGGRQPSAALRPDTSRGTLRILASVTADEVRFVGSPRICVRLTGDARLDSVRVLARRNLASPVVSNTTYRNVYVAVEILGRLKAECLASRITGAGADSTAAARCASLGVQDAAGGGRP